MNNINNINDNIIELAKKNSKLVKYVSINNFYHNKFFNENLYIKINKNKTIEFSENYCLRKDIITDIFKNQICPLLDIKNDFVINISLHDNCEEDGILCFGNKNNSTSVLIPDIYQMYNYKNTLFNKDNSKFINKKNKVIFCGSSTGDININNNDRVNTCIWSLKNNWAINNTYFKISNLVQIPKPEFIYYLHNNNIHINNIISDNISIDEQLKYKYILSIDGNTWAWDRPIWIMKSNSLFLKYESDNIGWYYNFLQEDINYISVNKNNMENKINFFENNTNQALEIISNSKKFVKDYCSDDKWKLYLKTLLEEISYK